MKCRNLALVLIAGLAILACLAWPVTAENLIPNPSFEEAADGKPAGWDNQNWVGQARFEHADVGHTGNRSVSVDFDQPGDGGWVVHVRVQPHATYRLSGWIKTEDVQTSGGRGAIIGVHNIQPVVTPAVLGTSDWKRGEVVFETGQNISVQIHCFLGAWGTVTGRAWFDDLKLEKLSMENWKPSIAIDATDTGEPISKYIYGQLIEHLSRCVYGGIWAEMIEDRKFYYPVGQEQSPWKPIGAVAMNETRPFVGQHSVRIATGGDGQPDGIVQEGLGLRKGKEYVGHIWLKGVPEAKPVHVNLAWGDGSGDEQTVLIEELPGPYAKFPLKFTAGTDTDNGRLTIVSSGNGTFHVGTVSLMPADNIQGFRRDTLTLMKELDSTVYRWPGGNFVSGYDWMDGIGERDRREPKRNPTWGEIDPNDVGIHEFMALCRLLDTEPYIVVNSGYGDVAASVEELQYCNGSVDTPMGKLRAENGHPQPFGVKWWAIGNEMWGDFQLGYMPLQQYITKHNRFAKAMRAEDPSIKLTAVGAVGPWSEEMMARCADQMDLISEHFYSRHTPPGLVSHVKQIPDTIRRTADAHRRYRRDLDSLRGKNIRIALEEWNYWYGPDVFGPYCPRFFLKDALGIAAGLHEFARQSDIYLMAHYSQTVNVLGCIKTTKTDASLATTGLVLKLYRKHFGTLPLKVTTQSPLDVAAALSDDGKTLTIGIVNPTMTALELPLSLNGVKLTGRGTRYQIAGDDPMAYNEPGQERKITIEESSVRDVSKKLSVVPCSVTLYKLDVK